MAKKMKSIGVMLLLIVFLFNLSACAQDNRITSRKNEAASIVTLKAVAQSASPSATKTSEHKPVLYIYHTHSLETYADGTSVIKIGKALADYISETYGVKVIHDTTEYGKVSIKDAYADSLKGLQSALKSNPDITHFFDIHIDAGRAMYTRIDEKKIAPISLVIGKGTEYLGEERPNYDSNHAFAMAIYEQLATHSSNLVFPLVEKDGRYNQHISGFCALMNIGFGENDFEEAAAVIPYLAEAIVNSIES